MQLRTAKKASDTCFFNRKGDFAMNDMFLYKIIYQKSNGVVFERIRNTLPLQKIGEETSMGWKIVDILYHYKDKWYSSSTQYYEYKKALRMH